MRDSTLRGIDLSNLGKETSFRERETDRNMSVATIWTMASDRKEGNLSVLNILLPCFHDTMAYL